MAFEIAQIPLRECKFTNEKACTKLLVWLNLNSAVFCAVQTSLTFTMCVPFCFSGFLKKAKTRWKCLSKLIYEIQNSTCWFIAGRVCTRTCLRGQKNRRRALGNAPWPSLPLVFLFSTEEQRPLQITTERFFRSAVCTVRLGYICLQMWYIPQFKFLIVLFTKKLVLKQLVSVGNNLALQSPIKWWLAWRNQLVPGSLLSHRSHADCWTIIRCVNFPQVAYRLLYLKLVTKSKCNVSTNSP